MPQRQMETRSTHRLAFGAIAIWNREGNRSRAASALQPGQTMIVELKKKSQPTRQFTIDVIEADPDQYRTDEPELGPIGSTIYSHALEQMIEGYFERPTAGWSNNFDVLEIFIGNIDGDPKQDRQLSIGNATDVAIATFHGTEFQFINTQI